MLLAERRSAEAVRDRNRMEPGPLGICVETTENRRVGVKLCKLR